MKAPDFKYHHVTQIEEALHYLDFYKGNARVLAGGQSLIPMLNMRLWRPAALIDINSISELTQVKSDGEQITISALVRYSEIENSTLISKNLPLLKKLISYIGDRQVRNRGTIGGSIVQGDPTGEVPLGCLVLDARLRVVNSEGERIIRAEDFYEGSYSTVLEDNELLTEIIFPKHPTYYAFREVCRRHNDFAVLSIAATGEINEKKQWTNIRIGLGAVNEKSVLARTTMSLLDNSYLNDSEIQEASESILNAIDPPSDIRGSAEYRTHLLPLYLVKVLKDLRSSAD